MIERRENLSLVAKALDDKVIVESRVDQLDGHAMLKLAISASRFVHRAHTTAAQLASDAIRSHVRTDHRCVIVTKRFGCRGICRSGLMFFHAKFERRYILA